MRTITVLLTLFFTINYLSSEIDNLKTNDDVQNFLVKKVNPKWEGEFFFQNKGKNDTSAYGKGKFFKIDLDENGLSDLIINGTYLFAVTDNGNGNYNTHFIDRGTFMLARYTLKNIIYKNKTPLLIISKTDKYDRIENISTKTDTLILKFGDFYEYNSTPSDLKIDEISFSTSECFGTCPIFELKIKADRSAKYNAIKYNQKKGKFKTVIDSVTFNKISETINYLKLASLKNEYSVNWTDDQTSTLIIKFNNGKTKKISDYGMIGTFGLENLYNQLFLLRSTQKWKK